MLTSSFNFSSPGWLWPAVGLVLAVLLLVAWGYRATPPSYVRWACAALKTFALLALAACLLEPLWSGQRAKPGANSFAIVADNSQGLQIKDQGDSHTRAEHLIALLDPANAAWQSALEDNFELRRFYFDTRLQATRDFHELDFQGRATALGSSLRNLRDRFAGRPLSGVLLLTDGNATDFSTRLPDLRGLPPIYPVVLGKSSMLCDAAIAEVNVAQTDFEDAPVAIQANVSTLGLRGENVRAELLDSSGKTLQQQTARARKDVDTLAFRFQVRPLKPGISFYRIKAVTDAGSSASAQAIKATTREATLLNNERVVPVDRGRGPYRVLYVGGRPNWEYKFLHRAIDEDEQMQLVALIRIAKREAKFDFRGRGGETGNPLFRGFGNQSREEVDRYDQPVLVHLNTRDEFELRSGFPTTREELYAYQAVIVDDAESAFFTPDQSMLLQRYVAERGGGFLMLGGMECFEQGDYARTPIGDMLPVYLDGAQHFDAAQPVAIRLNLTLEGMLQPWVRMRENEADEKRRLDEMPAFHVLNPVRSIKPGASILATATDQQGKQFPALVTQRFGRGRTAAFTIGDFWRWGMESPEQRRDFEKAWRQIVRWLIADVPKPVELAVQPAADTSGEAVLLQVRAHDPKFLPLEDASVTIEIQPAAATNATSVRLRAEPSATQAGVYEAQYVPHATGGYLAKAFVTNSIGVEAGRAEVGWATDLVAEEFRSLQPNTALLEDLARRTGGKVVSAEKLDQFAAELPTHKAPVMEPWTTPAWHTPGVLLFALACLAGEWGLRRWKGIP